MCCDVESFEQSQYKPIWSHMDPLRIICMCLNWLLEGPRSPRGPTQPKPGPGQILEIWEPGDPESWNSRKCKFSKSKSMSPKMSARSGFAGKRSSQAHLVPLQTIFSMDRKRTNIANNALIFPGRPREQYPCFAPGWTGSWTRFGSGTGPCAGERVG